MSSPKITLNKSALVLFKQLCDQSAKYGTTVEQTPSGATLVDAGINAEGGFLAGQIITERADRGRVRGLRKSESEGS